MSCAPPTCNIPCLLFVPETPQYLRSQVASLSAGDAAFLQRASTLPAAALGGGGAPAALPPRAPPLTGARRRAAARASRGSGGGGGAAAMQLD